MASSKLQILVFVLQVAGGRRQVAGKQYFACKLPDPSLASLLNFVQFD